MFTVLSILFCAIIAGAILLRMGFKLQMERALDITVFVLIALFGLSIGQDDNLLHNASSIGWAALLIASLGYVGEIYDTTQRIFPKKFFEALQTRSISNCY